MKKAITWKRTTALATCALMLAATAAGGLATMDRGAVSAADAYTVDVSKGMQEFDGWGLSLSWWATEAGGWTRIGSSGKEKREEVAEALFGKTGLDLNIARYNIGGGDDPSHTHMSDDRNTPGWRGASQETRTDPSGHEYTATVLDDYVWVGENGEIIPWEELENTGLRTDYRQLWMLDWIQNNPARAEDYISEFYSNSPPYWMTMSGCSSGGVGGGQNLDYSNNQAFVDYFLDVYEYLTSQGFEFGNLQPFNESVNPDSRQSSYWGVNGDQEGCYFSAEQKVIVLDLLKKEMERRGLDVPYNWGDETNTTGAWQEYSDALKVNYAYGGDEANAVGSDIVRGADRYTYHIYWYNMDGVQRFYRAAKGDGKDLYMSEICWSEGADNGEAEYDPDSLKTGFKYTQSIIDTVKYGGVDGYVFWQGMEDMVGQMKGGTNYGLIQGVYYTQEEAEDQGVDLAAMGLNYQDFVLAKAYYMSGQYTKYIRPGYRIVDVNEDNTIAAVSPDGETLVIVKQNNGDATNIRFDLNGFNARSIEKIVTDKDDNWTHSALSVTGNFVSDKLSEKSVTTYVIHGNKTVGDSKFVDESAMQSKANLAAIKTAIAENGETEQCYQTGFSANGGDGKYFGQTSYSQNGYLAYHFNGTGIALSFLKKSDAGAIDIYIDTDPEDANAAFTTVDLSSSTKIPGEIVYTDNTLDEGWHTIYVKAAKGDNGSWVNLDGAFLYTSADAEAATNSLYITEARGLGSNVSFNYTASGLEGYEFFAEYRNGSEWTRTPQALADESGSIEGVSGDTVCIRIAAVKGTETVYSPEYVVNMMRTEATEGVLYFVDCATDEPNKIATGAVLGELQSVSDQAFGEDVLGYSWGYKNGPYTSYYASEEAMSSIWSLDKVDATAIEYEFTIPTAGAYKVALGFFGGEDGWGNRTVKATVTGAAEQTVTLGENAYTGLFFDVTTAADGATISVKVERSDAAQNSSHLSLIAITEADVQLPLYADCASSLGSYGAGAEDITIGDDLYGKFEEKTFKLYYSDGTSEDIPYADTDVTVEITTIAVSQKIHAIFSLGEGIEFYADYRWIPEGGSVLYYNIDCGYIGTGTPPDDNTECGIYQSTTHDRQYGSDTKGYEWGYVGSHYDEGVNWKDDKENKWSIREGKDGSDKQKYVEYKMTGFSANELLRIEVAGHCSNWGNRTVTVLCNGTALGDWELVSSKDGTITKAEFEGETVKANESGELVVRVQQKTGEGAQLGYIKVWSTGPALPQEKTVTANAASFARGGKVTLNDVTEGSTVYLYDENDHLTGVIAPAAHEGAASYEINVDDYLPATSYELHVVQIIKGGSALSEELVLSLDKADVEIFLENDFVQDGDAVVIRFLPQVSRGVTSLTLTTPGGVKYDVAEGFYFRATENGEYAVTIVSGSATTTKKFTVQSIDALSLNATFDKEGWTKENVTVTLAPSSPSGGIRSVEIDGTAASANKDGKYTFTATENGEHTVTVVTAAGFTYERTVTVGNIDKTAPTLALTARLTADGVLIDYEATSLSGGKLYADYNGTQREITDEATFSLNAAGKYEIYFVNGAGESTAKTTYYITYGIENAQLATVSADDDGVLSAGTAEAKLYRAGEDAPVESMKADKVGKYYLDIASADAREIVVLYVQAREVGGGIGNSNVSAEEEGGCGSVIAAPAAVIGALVLVCGAAAVIFVKRRKNS